MNKKPSHCYLVSSRWMLDVSFDDFCRSSKCLFGNNAESPLFILPDGRVFTVGCVEDGIVPIEASLEDGQASYGTFDLVLDSWMTMNPDFGFARTTQLRHYLLKLISLGDGTICPHSIGGQMCLTSGVAFKDGDKIRFFLRVISRTRNTMIRGHVDKFQECRIEDCTDEHDADWGAWEEILAQEFMTLADDLEGWIA